MTKEKMISLESYRNQLMNRLSGAIPDKHKNHPESFKNFIRNELRLVESKIEAAKLETSSK